MLSRPIREGGKALNRRGAETRRKSDGKSVAVCLPLFRPLGVSAPRRFQSAFRKLLRAAPLLLLLLTAPASAAGMRIVVQRSPLAGAQYYALAELWPLLKVGDTLELVREAGNAHDPHAVRIEWRGRKLGYVPRAENRAVAAALDGGEALAARIASQQKHRSPWRRMQFDILVEM